MVRARKEIQRKDGGLIRFDDNACVLINKTGDPIGTRLTSKATLQSFVLQMLMDLQALSVPNCATSSGRKSSRWPRYMYDNRSWDDGKEAGGKPAEAIFLVESSLSSRCFDVLQNISSMRLMN